MKFVVYQIVYGGDVDGTGPERWRGMEFARFDTEEEAEAYVDQCNEACEVDVEDTV
jgi:viroplasmin and RNaseH domain-containing protein